MRSGPPRFTPHRGSEFHPRFEVWTHEPLRSASSDGLACDVVSIVLTTRTSSGQNGTCSRTQALLEGI